MKKLILMSIVAMLLSVTTQAQKLLETYQKGPVKLIADQSFAQGNDWNTVFDSYNDKMGNTHIGARKSIKMLPNGSMLVNHAYKDYISLFSANGKFVKKLQLEKESGGLRKKASIAGVLDSNIMFTGLDNMGNMRFYDMNGKYLKKIVLDYMTKQIIPLPNRKIAVVGWVIWTDRFRDFVSIVDYETGEETIIWDHFTTRDPEPREKREFIFNYTDPTGEAKEIKRYMYVSSNMGPLGLRPAPKVTYHGNKVIIAIPPTGEIMEYSMDGKLLRKDKTNWTTGEIPASELEANRLKKQKEMDNYEPPKSMVNKMGYDNAIRYKKEMIAFSIENQQPITKSYKLPFFSTFMKDSDNNLLFFEYPDEEGENKFNVYTFDGNGKFVCQSSFVCDDYKLVINNDRLIFKDGNLYGVQELKETSGIPVRLVKFKLSN